MCTGLEAAAWAASAASAYSAVNANANAKDSIAAQQQASAAALANKPQASKAPDMSSIDKANAAIASAGGSMSGNSGTFLTGGTGIDPNKLNLGKSTLLGS